MTADKIIAQGMLPLYYHSDAAVCISVASALYDAGIKCIEFTNRGENALSNFRDLVRERNRSMPNLQLGVGTIACAFEAHNFIDAGADFLVSPFFDEDIRFAASARDKLWIPGCMTPTEIHKAQQAGCTLVKIFPGNVVQPGFLEAILQVFKGVSFMVTGGVETSESDLSAWFKSGAACVGIGSKLITPDLMNRGDYGTLEKNTAALLAAAKRSKG